MRRDVSHLWFWAGWLGGLAFSGATSKGVDAYTVTLAVCALMNLGTAYAVTRMQQRSR